MVGEFEPLPTVSDPDFMRAEWARMRGAELARVAERLEREDPVEAQRVWLHAQCLAPGDRELARRAEQAPATLPS